MKALKYILILIIVFAVIAFVKLFVWAPDEIKVIEIPEVKNMPDKINFPQEPVNGWEGKG